MSILVCIREREEITPLIIWGQRFAQARNESLHIIYLKSGRVDIACTRLAVMPEADEEPDQVIVEIRDAIEHMHDHVSEQQQADKAEPHKSNLPGIVACGRQGHYTDLPGKK